ncbi:MAG: hypothetical protein A3D24_01760 [Candidatus Blackburnbacteria bacterium RIFCSPHIGHO2_02_FULL_39_13]|uniref:Uncharacterized protein n=1 Tax=Candidatus Blackburnbacteria bacterium RIFCSPLOWO2_01_FULL_40_20 TaxID=1797519 RepID=A0A1G1VC18_9BACT|nr:MAG: hypothetical protein UT38_C0005G0012 [Microgenomates group bacterium GW2011_GWA2_39_19]OGY06845.1 MAG: hypothetical protein A2694_00810 [Candidatus Blackburnbacteria bacterium RIFCSPHIGHO2_01_FULL_40_17]OGY07946.1 MAG: hypothetical protein A3D24_01760 [Candidatus Blackburnbacteria bacterium RIFCSPHIGHO2_02_FULL_39_13]OGY13003.1 MAG: hypothetical protein A3A77_01665 [Candidatus Blackburnbacteria bacterium RIFCSPLOWO2_01_FULL_40_20]HBL51772.1 hypothetical protein [Candidatus Blackburnbact
MSNKIWVFILTSCFLAFIGSMFFVLFGVKNRMDTRVSVFDFTVIKDPVRATFVPKHDYLNVVVAAFKNPDLRSSDSFLFSIVDDKDAILRQIEFSGKNMRDPSDLRFQFDPLVGFAGKEIGVRVEPKAAPGEHPVSVSTTKDGQVAFAAYYRTTGKSAVVKEILANWVSNVKTDLVFFGLWGAILGLIFWKGLKTREN